MLSHLAEQPVGQSKVFVFLYESLEASTLCININGVFAVLQQSSIFGFFRGSTFTQPSTAAALARTYGAGVASGTCRLHAFPACTLALRPTSRRILNCNFQTVSYHHNNHHKPYPSKGGSCNCRPSRHGYQLGGRLDEVACRPRWPP